MKRGIPEHKETQVVVLARMAATRAALVSTSQLPDIGTGLARTARHPSIDAGPVLLRTPNAALFALVLVGLVVIGPRQILVLSFRAGLTAWITKTVRTFTGR
jgi:hypothetical protein